MKLSIIIPVFNEEKTVTTVLEQIVAVSLGKVEKEIIVIDDGSRDKTVQKVETFLQKTKQKNLHFIKQIKNQGKGSAVKAGIAAATGDYIVIQDADLEYDPRYVKDLLQPIIAGKADIVYGTRLKRLPNFVNEERNFQFFMHYLGNRFLSFVTSLIYFTWITDMETCYKIFPRKAMQKITLHAKGFAFEPEITAKLLKLGLRVVELPIKTKPRGYEEGKKLVAVKEGPLAIWTLIKYRFTD